MPRETPTGRRSSIPLGLAYDLSHSLHYDPIMTKLSVEECRALLDKFTGVYESLEKYLLYRYSLSKRGMYVKS